MRRHASIHSCPARHHACRRLVVVVHWMDGGGRWCDYLEREREAELAPEHDQLLRGVAPRQVEHRIVLEQPVQPRVQHGLAEHITHQKEFIP